MAIESNNVTAAALLYTSAVAKLAQPKLKLKQFDDKLHGFGGHTPTFMFGCDLRMTTEVMSLCRKQLLAEISASEIDIEIAFNKLMEACGASTT